MMISIAGGLVFIGVVAFVYLEVQEKARFAAIASFLVCAVLGAGVLFGYPNYCVWEQGKQGEAALAKATQDRQIKVQEAEAEMEAASKQAEANKLLGESIRAYPEAMEQKWVEAIANTQNQVIYLPTEASVPITESGRMALKKQQEASRKDK